MPGEFTFDSGRRPTRVIVRPGGRHEVPTTEGRRTLVVSDDSVANSFSAVGCVQLVPKYKSKVKLDRGQSPNILSEIIEIDKNGA